MKCLTFVVASQLKATGVFMLPIPIKALTFNKMPFWVFCLFYSLCTFGCIFGTVTNGEFVGRVYATYTCPGVNRDILDSLWLETLNHSFLHLKIPYVGRLSA